jgi:hypothetical protein
MIDCGDEGALLVKCLTLHKNTPSDPNHAGYPHDRVQIIIYDPLARPPI